MDFAKAGRDVGLDEVDRFFHRHGGRFVLPTVRAQMIAAKNNTFSRETDGTGDVVDEVTEIGRLHAGVAAKLIHLVGCRFDQHLVVSRQIET